MIRFALSFLVLCTLTAPGLSFAERAKRAGEVVPRAKLETWAKKFEMKEFNAMHAEAERIAESKFDQQRVKEFRDKKLAMEKATGPEREAASREYFRELHRVIKDQDLFTITGSERDASISFNTQSELGRIMGAMNRLKPLLGDAEQRYAVADAKLQGLAESDPAMYRAVLSAARSIAQRPGATERIGNHGMILEAMAGLMGDLKAAKSNKEMAVKDGSAETVKCVGNCAALSEQLKETAEAAIKSGASPATVADYLSSLRDLAREQTQESRNATVNGIASLTRIELEQEAKTMKEMKAAAENGIAKGSELDKFLRNEVKNGDEVVEQGLNDAEIKALEKVMKEMTLEGKATLEAREELAERLRKEGLDAESIEKIMEKIRTKGTEAKLERIKKLAETGKISKEDDFHFICGNPSAKPPQKPCSYASPGAIMRRFGSAEGKRCLKNIAIFAAGTAAGAGAYAYLGPQSEKAQDQTASAAPQSTGGRPSGAPAHGDSKPATGGVKPSAD